MIFLVDAMLGNIAKKLRLFGFDSTYFSDIEDSELIEKAKREERIIISKDRHLIQRAKRKGILSIYITKEDEARQFLEILKIVDLKLDKVSGETARCTKCNTRTSQTGRLEIKDKIPVGILERNDKFWECEKCCRVYWEGTHIKKMQEFLNKIKYEFQKAEFHV